MTWETIINDLMNKNHLTTVGIFGLDGVQYAATPGFPLSPESVQQLIASFTDSSVRLQGLTVGQNKYNYLSFTEDFIVYKMGSSGIVGYKSNSTVIIGFHEANAKPMDILGDLQGASEFLLSAGF